MSAGVEGRKGLRGLLWGLLVVALVAVVAAALWDWLQAPPPPPVLGEVPPFSLTNRDGRTVTLADLAGTPWVADFIFTRCPASCPLMTHRMARLEADVPDRLPVRFVSLTVDPEFDTPEVLEAYAGSFDAPERWLFLTGEPEELYRLTVQGFKLALDVAPPPGVSEEPILHSTRFVLVDGEGRVRGYYGAFDEEEMERLRGDLVGLAG